jgi:hypothetical protein
MFRYEVFGGVLGSSFEFPELPPLEGDALPTWSVTRGSDPPRLLDERLLGEDVASPELRPRLYQAADRLRLDYGPIGTFDLSPCGTRITWYPGTHDCEECGRQCILGRVLGLAVALGGELCLHGSCVELGGRAVAFLGGKGSGKSTLAAALGVQGARLVTDDMLRALGAAPVQAAPGIRRLRLRPDSAAAAEHPGMGVEHAHHGKLILDVGEEPLAPLPLAAIYILQPRPAGSANLAVTREARTGSRAAITLLSHLMVGSLLGARTAELFRIAARLGAEVPLYTLRVPRDLRLLPSVAACLFAWHPGPTGSPEDGAGGSGVVRVA